LLVAPRGTPDDIVLAYQNAVETMKHDPDYIARKEAALGTYEQVTGRAAQTMYELATNVPLEARTWVKEWLKREFRVNLET
jgi:hypothetical protein